MKEIEQLILKPTKGILILFSFFSFLFLLLYVWYFSFVWAFIFGVNSYIIGLILLLVIGWFRFNKLDRLYNWHFKSYFSIAIVQLLIIWTISTPVRTWQIDRSLVRAKEITGALSTYKQKLGQYPENLIDLEMELCVKLPKRTCLGTKYWYKKSQGEDYSLYFNSYHGYAAHYSPVFDDWGFSD